MHKGIFFFMLLFLALLNTVQVFANKYEAYFWEDSVDTKSSYYQQGFSWAMLYVQSHLNDDYWVWKTPKLESFGVLYYTDDELSPAYIEYKIVCGKIDCWSVMVNLDWYDSLIPEWSTFGKATYENAVINGKIEKSRLYRFWVLEQYSVSTTWEWVKSIFANKGTISYDTIGRFKNMVKIYKETTDFKKKQLDFQNSINTKVQPMVYTAFPTYTNTYIPWSSTVNCPSRTPCYAQYPTTGNCYLWCSPNALAILYGYYDRQWSKPNLISWTATDISYTWNPAWTWFAVNSAIKTMSDSISASMGTSCWWTSPSSIKNWKAYAIGKGYTWTVATYGTISNVADTKNIVSQEVNAWRPILLSTSGHTFVAYGYSSTASNYWIRVNYGLTVNQDTWYFWRDVDAASMSLPAVGWSFTSYTKFIIQ